MMYLNLEFSDGSKDEGSPSENRLPFCHHIDIPADKRIVGVYGHRINPDPGRMDTIESLGFLLIPKLG